MAIRVDHLAFELQHFRDGREYWAFSLFVGDENVGVGSAGDLTTCISMAQEMAGDVEAGKLWKGCSR